LRTYHESSSTNFTQNATTLAASKETIKSAAHFLFAFKTVSKNILFLENVHYCQSRCTTNCVSAVSA
jgi:hypothetical protein